MKIKFFGKLKELFNDKSKEEKQIQKIIDNPILLNNVYLKVLELQSQSKYPSYLG